MKKILLVGADGYIGKPLYEKIKTKYKVIAVDNFSKRKLIKETNGKSLTKIPEKDKEIIEIQLDENKILENIFKNNKFDCVINLGAQPSMPYSQIDYEHAEFTQTNNNALNRQILWNIKKYCPKTKYIITTTMGVYGQPNDLIKEEILYKPDAGSWYHISRAFDGLNCWLAHKQWKLNIAECRTGIVYGYDNNPLWCDNIWGVVVHRFIAQALKGKELTIYGKGEQQKPFVYLKDVVDSIINLIEYNWNGYFVINQCAQTESIVNLAKAIKNKTGIEYKHIPNPRVENETKQMKLINENFVKVLDRKPLQLKEGISELYNKLMEEENVMEKE